MKTDRETPSLPTVCIITYCQDLTYLYGTLLTVKTIRLDRIRLSARED